MKLKPKSYIYTSDHFHNYNDSIAGLFCELTSQNPDDISEENLKNLTIDGLYSVIANYTSFVREVGNQEISNLPFINNLHNIKEHLYYISIEDIIDLTSRHYDLNPMLNDYFYDIVIGDKLLSEIEKPIEETTLVCRMLDDMLIRKILYDYDDYSMTQDVILLYVNLVNVNKIEKALHIIMFEEV